LRLLLAAGATVAGTWAVDVAVGADDADSVRLLLDAAARQTPEQVPTMVTGLLTGRSATASAPVVEALLEAGANPTRLDPNGLTPLRQAVRAGNERTAVTLRRNGAPEDTTDIDRFVGACARGDRAAAERLLIEQPDMRDRLSDRDRAAIVDVADSGTTGAVRLMLELGFSPRARNSFGETPLHAAAAAGNADTVRLLLEHGAELDARDANFQGTPLGFATVSSGEHRGTRRDWVETVRLLLDAGADPTGVWVPSSPPSEDVADVLQTYGVTSNDDVPR
jgi:ankyrin repeat protein